MEFFETIKTRHSCRSFKTEPVPGNLLTQVLEAARTAPSGSNKQPWKFVVVKDEPMRKALVPACKGQEFVGEAPVVIVACGEVFETNRGDWMGWHGMLLDIAIAMDHMQLAAHALGLATCWIGAFNADEVRRLLDIPEKLKVVGLLPLGYAAGPLKVSARKPLEEIVCYEKYAL
jgi:nitroreductase